MYRKICDNNNFYPQRDCEYFVQESSKRKLVLGKDKTWAYTKKCSVEINKKYKYIAYLFSVLKMSGNQYSRYLLSFIPDGIPAITWYNFEDDRDA